MDSDEFMQSHAKWKYGKKLDANEESTATWLMTESGAYFLLEGDLELELQRMRDMDMPCTVHHNATSLNMKDLQAEKRGASDEPSCIQKL
jgi:hypothetical protein